jgi:CDP-diacylglycerol--serine O-phosphatidyltransferase
VKNLRERLIDPHSPDRMPRRAAYALPTFFTAGNVFLGFFAIMESFRGAMDTARGWPANILRRCQRWAGGRARRADGRIAR